MSESGEQRTDERNLPVQDGGTSNGEIVVAISGKFIWQAIGAILGTLVLLWAFDQASGIVSMVAISFFFSLALEPAVRWLTDRYEWRRGSATGVIYVVGALFVVFMIVVLIPAIAELATAIGAKGGEWINNLSEFTNDNLGFEITDIDTAADLAAGTDVALQDWAAGAFGTVLGIATTGISLIFNLATIAMFTFYFTAEAPQVQRAVLRLFSPKMQQQIGWTWDQAIIQTGGYFYSRMILMVINGFGFFFTMVAVGIAPPIYVPIAGMNTDTNPPKSDNGIDSATGIPTA
ncbi:MAG: AI-2E family transporter, partial [Actinomycetota bacterium]|nr:AI-2E family transporter [Actinomycetota bacterium]